MKTRLFVTFTALALFATPSALADVPPDPDYVETCTIDNVKKDGESCDECGSFHGSIDKCPDLYAGKGWTKRCQTGGASVWTEIWCGTGPSPDQPQPAKPEPTAPTHDEPTPAEPAPAEPAANVKDDEAPKKDETTTSKCGAATPGDGLAFGGLLLGLWLVSRRRHTVRARA